MWRGAIGIAWSHKCFICKGKNQLVAAALRQMGHRGYRRRGNIHNADQHGLV